MLKNVIASIGWFKSALLMFGATVLLYNSYEGSQIHDFYMNAPVTSLDELTENYKLGDWVKVNQFRLDFKNRVRGLVDKNKAENVHYLIPLRPFGEEQNEDVHILYLMGQKGDFIRSYYEEHKENYYNDMFEIDELVAEYITVDELKGDISLAVLKNKKVSDDVIILHHKANNPVWGVFFVGGMVFLGIWIILFLIHYFRWKKKQPKFYN